MKFFFQLNFIFLFLISFQIHAATSEPYEFFKLSSEETERLELFEDEDLKNKVFCHVEDHLEEYTNYIQNVILTRLKQEIPQLTRFHKTHDTKERGQVASHLSSGDLYHSHVRLPITNIKSNSLISPVLTSPETYHLQYHSFENVLKFRKDWIHTLLTSSDTELSQWAQDILNFEEKQSQPSFSRGQSLSSNTPSTGLKKLSPMEIRKKAQAWMNLEHSASDLSNNDRKWLLNRYENQVKIVDPFDLVGGRGPVMKDRSVVSFEERFKIISQINIDGYIQPATVYFAPHSQIPNFEALMDKAKDSGANFILNAEASLFETHNYYASTNWKEQKQLFQSLKEQVVSIKKENFIFKDIFKNPREADRHIIFMWDEDYLYSINYFLNCERPQNLRVSSLKETDI